MANFTFKQIWTLCLDFPESFSDLLFKKISENVFLKRSEHWFLTSKSLKVLFLNCCLWQTIIAIICKILWFASLSQKMVVIVMINYLQKSKKKPFSKVHSILFSQSIFKTYFKNVCPDKFLISFVLKAFPHFPRKWF